MLHTLTLPESTLKLWQDIFEEIRWLLTQYFFEILQQNWQNADPSKIPSFAFFFFLGNRSFICHVQKGGKLRGCYCIIVKNTFPEKCIIFFQFFNSKIIIMNCFILVEVLYSPDSSKLFNSAVRKLVSFLCLVLLSCWFVCLALLSCWFVFCIPLLIFMYFNVGKNMFPEYGSMLLNSGIWCESQIIIEKYNPLKLWQFRSEF